MDFDFFQSEGFLVGYYVLTVGMSLLLIRETRSRLRDLRKGLRSSWYAVLPFGVVLVYVLVGFGPLDEIPVLNWSWLGYNIAFGPYAGEGIWGILPFVPLLVYMFIHINYIEEFYFRKSKKMVVAWALLHIAMGIKVHTALILIPVGFLFKYVYDKKGIEHSYAMHFASNALVVVSLLLATVAQSGLLGE